MSIKFWDRFYIFDGDKSQGSFWFGWYGTAKMLGGLAGAITVSHIPISRFTTTRTLILLGFTSVVASWWLFNPAFPWLQIPQGFVFGFCANGIFLLCTSFLGDVADVEAAQTGNSRQGFYSASLEFAKKCAISASTFFSGVVISFSGADAVQQLDDPTRLRYLFILVLGISLLLGFLSYRLFERSARADIERLAAERGARREAPGQAEA